MERRYTLWKQFLQSSDSGFTIVELLVASTLGLGVMGLVLASTLSNRNVFKYDMVRTQMNQDLRGTMDILGMNIREAGENLPPTFPAVLIVDGASGTPDELVLRRNLMDEVLKVCQPITTGTNVYFASGGASGCSYGGNTSNYTAWQNYRNAQGGTAEVYVYNSSTRLGEWFSYDGEIDSGTEYIATASDGTWVNTYDAVASAVYVLEEWRFLLNGDVLQLVIDGDTANPVNVAFGIDDFQITAKLQGAVTQTSFTETDGWIEIESLDVHLEATDSFRGDPVSVSLDGEFFPRNVLSN